jgi:hypothetical protein
MHLKPRFELGTIVSQFYSSYEKHHHPNGYIEKTFKAIAHCRTAKLGGHMDACDSCGSVRISYNSCRNRHCPKCQNTNKEKWLEMMQHKTVSDTSYFHTVFTIPHKLNGLCVRYPREMYTLLFDSAWATIKGFAGSEQYKNLETGMTAVLHTWGQQLMLHPHLHCIIPAGGLDKNQKWQNLKGNGKFLYPIKPLQKVYRAKFVAGLRTLIKKGIIEAQSQEMFDGLFKKPWVVYAKRPFSTEIQVIEYLARYTHKVAISNHRLQYFDEQTVSFEYKDYADKSIKKTMQLSGEEFLRRFALHLLPKRFLKIRHYGLHANSNQSKLKKIQEVLDTLKNIEKSKEPQEKKEKSWKEICIEKLSYDPDKCACCEKGRMVHIAFISAARPPPGILKKLREKQFEASQL